MFWGLKIMFHHCTRGCRQIEIQSLLIMNCSLCCFFMSPKEKTCPEFFLTARLVFSVLQLILSTVSSLLPPVTFYYQQNTHISHSWDMNTIVRRAGLQHVATLRHVPYIAAAEWIDTNFDKSSSLIGVDTAKRQCWNRTCTEFLSKWF